LQSTMMLDAALQTTLQQSLEQPPYLQITRLSFKLLHLRGLGTAQPDLWFCKGANGTGPKVTYSIFDFLQCKQCKL